MGVYLGSENLVGGGGGGGMTYSPNAMYPYYANRVEGGCFTAPFTGFVLVNTVIPYCSSGSRCTSAYLMHRDSNNSPVYDFRKTVCGCGYFNDYTYVPIQKGCYYEAYRGTDAQTSICPQAFVFGGQNIPQYFNICRMCVQPTEPRIEGEFYYCCCCRAYGRRSSTSCNCHIMWFDLPERATGFYTCLCGYAADNTYYQGIIANSGDTTSIKALSNGLQISTCSAASLGAGCHYYHISYCKGGQTTVKSGQCTLTYDSPNVDKIGWVVYNSTKNTYSYHCCGYVYYW